MNADGQPQPFHEDDDGPESGDAGDGGMMACHACDALLRDVDPEPGVRARCPRCRALLVTGRAFAIDTVLACATATVVMMIAAVSLPFLTLSSLGLSRDASILDAAVAAGGSAWPLTVAVGAAIVAIPVARALALLYALAPVRISGAPIKGARAAFRLAVELRPWAMAEIFIIGVAIALVKVAGFATIGLGAAFGLFVALGFVAMFEDIALCRRTIWRILT